METLSKLSVIKTLHQTDIRLYELLEMREYPAAIQLLLECRQALQDYQQFDCLKQLSLKFERTLEKTEQQLDLALSKLCLDYNEETYAKLTSALTLLGRGPNVLDQLLMHFTSTIHNLSLVIIAKHGQHGEPGKKQYVDLCQAVNEDRYAECLRELAQAFYKLMVSYRQVLEWHERSTKDDDDEDSDSVYSRSEPESADGSGSSDAFTNPVESHFFRSQLRLVEPDNTLGSPGSSTYSSPAKEKIGEKCLARQKLRNGLRRLWSDMQQKFKLLLSSFCWHAVTEFDKFIAILNTTKVMVEVGELFCEQPGCSSDLEASAEEQCLRYLHSYHGQSLTTLKTYLEHESWELMPVRDGFSLDNLHEFCFLHAVQETTKNGKALSSSSSSLKTLPEGEALFTFDGRDPFAVEVSVHTRLLQLLLPQVDSREERGNGEIYSPQQISGNSREKLEQFTVDVECAHELYHAVYLAVPAKFLALPQLLESMSNVNWDLKDIQTQHSPYVDSLLQQLINLEQTLWDSHLPESVLKNFWIVTLRLCSQAFIEGFANAKKCSNAGRALMQLDWQQFLSKVERMRVKLKPIPDQNQVEALVRAYYLIDHPLEEWLSINGPFYSKKQLFGLINSMSHVNRKARQNLLQMIEEQRTF
ncbi:coiled-coil domain-containing protein 132-like [Tropilaelaps mercedesae]|uniref:Coiled-coil domain-containing protein 132-like n=1 Tax=Tropilaelaps mercedesae TaxID=418985 RepID=A0A1V9XBT7_9ACAR|nr:coiled-coil domain-containing protein 132-like [Tropilaelaps mercedesae]